jgi:hypothetical protein
MSGPPLILYHDDRLFVLDVNVGRRGTFEGRSESVLLGQISPDQDLVWTLTTRRNLPGLPPVRVDHFDTLAELLDYVREIEPTTPRRSLSGRPPNPTPSYDDHLTWLQGEGLEGAVATKLKRGGYHIHPDWMEKLRWEAGLVARHLGVDLPSWT